MSSKNEPSRRQEKAARVIRESVSDTISNRLSDPRLTGIVSVTDIDISPDLRNADIFLSIMGADEKQAKRTILAIQHATKHIQSRLGRKMTTKFCPRLTFHEDTKFRKTLDTLKLIEEVSKEFSDHSTDESDEAGEE
jgi:ribosome-binding factor A